MMAKSSVVDNLLNMQFPILFFDLHVYQIIHVVEDMRIVDPQRI
jgi:hypothetical protein